MNTDLATVNASAGSLIGPVMDVAMARERLMQFQQFVKEYLVEGEDFGTIPSTPKPTLYKPGADKLCELYGLADEYEVTQRTEDFDKGLFDYEVKCILVRKPEMTLVSSGLGSCNSYETKYRWRDSKRQCPACGKDAIIKGKEEYGGGWLCFAKKGGCGAKFGDNDTAITGQVVGRTQNEDVADIKNTILKMALKRAKISAVLSATRSSGVFTQDLEDIPKWEPPAQLAEGAISHQPASVPATSAPAQPSTQPTTQAPAGPTRLIKATPPDKMDSLVATVVAVKYWPKTSEFNASINVKFASPIEDVNQGVAYTVDVAVCWHEHLFDLIRSAVGMECKFLIKKTIKKKNVTDEWPTHYIHIEDVVSVCDAATGVIQEFKEGKAVPARK